MGLTFWISGNLNKLTLCCLNYFEICFCINIVQQGNPMHVSCKSHVKKKKNRNIAKKSRE